MIGVNGNADRVSRIELRIDVIEDDIKSIRKNLNDLRSQMASTHGMVRTEMEKLSEKMDKKFEKFSADMDTKFEKLSEKMSAKIEELLRQLHADTSSSTSKISSPSSDSTTSGKRAWNDEHNPAFEVEGNIGASKRPKSN